MNERFDLWMGQVLVRRWMIVTFVVGGVFSWLLLPTLFLFYTAFYSGFEFNWWSFSQATHNELPLGYTTLAMIAYGLFRGAYFHPLLNLPYGRRLSQTPWQLATPLPLGPLSLIGPDAAIVGLAAMLAGILSLSLSAAVAPLVAFATAYAFAVGVASMRINPHWSVGLFWFPFGGILMFAHQPVPLLLCGLVLVSLTPIAIRLALREFPYDRELRAKLFPQTKSHSARHEIPWPASPREPQYWAFHLSTADAILLAAVTGWEFFAFALLIADKHDAHEVLQLCYFLLIASAVAVRLTVYIKGHSPPISLVGRIATRRLLIPKYDVIFIAPLMAAAVGYALPKLLMFRFGFSESVAYPISAAVAIALNFGLPPRWIDWHYTGHYRESAGRLNSTIFVSAD